MEAMIIGAIATALAQAVVTVGSELVKEVVVKPGAAPLSNEVKGWAQRQYNAAKDDKVLQQAVEKAMELADEGAETPGQVTASSGSISVDSASAVGWTQGLWAAHRVRRQGRCTALTAACGRRRGAIGGGGGGDARRASDTGCTSRALTAVCGHSRPSP
jgi:hypothetical protein